MVERLTTKGSRGSIPCHPPLNQQQGAEMPNCPRCNIPLKPGVAIQNTTVWSRDFFGDEEADITEITMSVGGPGTVINVLRCYECGFSRDEKGQGE